MSGPGKDYEPDDPTELVGVRLPRDLDETALHELALAIVEEYALLGWPRERVLGLFANPRFAGPHRAWLGLGAERVRAIVEAAFPRREGRDA